MVCLARGTVARAEAQPLERPERLLRQDGRRLRSRWRYRYLPRQATRQPCPLQAVAVAQTNRVVVPPQSPGREGLDRPHVRPSRSNRRPRWTRLTSGGNAPLLPQHNETPAAGFARQPRRNPAAHAPSSDTCSAFVGSISIATPTSLLSAERSHPSGDRFCVVGCPGARYWIGDDAQLQTPRC